MSLSSLPISNCLARSVGLARLRFRISMNPAQASAGTQSGKTKSGFARTLVGSALALTTTNGSFNGLGDTVSGVSVGFVTGDTVSGVTLCRG